MIRVLFHLRDVIYQSCDLLSPDSLLPEKPLTVVKCLYRAYQVEDRTLAGQLQCFIAFELLQFGAFGSCKFWFFFFRADCIESLFILPIGLHLLLSTRMGTTCRSQVIASTGLPAHHVTCTWSP